ncbi:MAG TPA: hypothetical protein PK490_22095 [Prosthecobacter sp.]|nr:hypothetical protein [Prosthecobacter sp.]HRK16990.1 hypothetical protein [Prosthecobacter sp.]
MKKKAARKKAQPAKSAGGGGDARRRKTRGPDMDSGAGNFSQGSGDGAGKVWRGWIHNEEGKMIAKIEALSADDLDAALEGINAGGRIIQEAKAWNMKPEDYWQLENFPSNPDDWEVRMQRLIASKLVDFNSDTDGLMHSCTWIIDLLWKWLHEVAVKTENPNHKRDAGRTLGRLYHQARQEGEEERLSSANEEFRSNINPFPWARRPPSKALVNWTNRKMHRHLEFWKKAVEVAAAFEDKKPFSRDDRDSQGVHHFQRLPMMDMKEAWQSYFIQERNAYPGRSGSWSDFLDELEIHPFRKRMLALSQLTAFKECWKLALYDVIKEEWNKDLEIKKACGSKFVGRFGDKTHLEGAGFHLAEDFFKRSYLPQWNQKKRLKSMMEQMIRCRKKQAVEG